MKNKALTAASALALALTVQAQTDVAAHFDMTLGADGTITESVSGRSFSVNHALPLENVSGAAGLALRLDGYSTYAEAAVSAATLSQQSLTVSLWCAPETYPMMNATEAENAQTLIAGNLDDNSRAGFGFTLTSQGDYGFKCYTGGWAVTLTASGKLPRYEWSHLVATIDAQNSRVTLYRNGQEVATSRCMSPINTGADAFIIGRALTGRTFDNYLLDTFNGLIDDITIYNRVMTADEAALPAPENAADLSIPASRYAGDLLRPAFHGMPATAWTNECHGMAYSDGRYHLFFQKNANGPYMARLHWGHIWSENLYKWHEDRIALTPDSEYDIKGCWSGAVFTDPELTGGRPAIIYTGVDNAKASIDMALPDDDMLTQWTKLEGNPLIAGRPEGLSDDFRDPYFFTSEGRKYIIVGSSKGGTGTTTLHEYNPQTGTWSNDGRTFFSGTSANINGTFWEMPNITDMGGKWLFTVTPLNTQSGVETHYWTGDIDADGKFVPTSSDVSNPSKVELEGFSREGFGLLSPTIFRHDGKTIMLGIVPDKLPSDDNYRMGWAHCYSLPREISLDAEGKLVQRPYSGLTAMRTAVHYSRKDFDLNGTEPLDPVSGRKVELLGEFVAGQGDFGFNFYKSGDRQARLCFSPADNTLTVDISGLERLVNDAGVFNGVYRSELPRRIQAGETVRINAFIDHSILDVFINDTWAFSMRLFPTDPSAAGIEAFADATTRVNSLDAWTLDENSGSPSGIEAAAQAAAVSLRPVSGGIAYSGATADSVLSVYSVDGRMLSHSRLDVGNGIVAVPHRGACIAKVVTADGVVSRKIMLR